MFLSRNPIKLIEVIWLTILMAAIAGIDVKIVAIKYEIKKNENNRFTDSFYHHLYDV